MTRIVMGLALLAGLGCSKATEPPKVEEPKPGEKKTDPPAVIAGPQAPIGPGPTPPAPPGPTLLAPNDPIQKVAEGFITDLRAASDKPEPVPAELLARVSPAFLKVIGKPLLSDADKAAGYSASAASNWLKNTGAKLVGIGLPTGYGSPTSAVMTGSFGNGTGRVLIRMTFQGGWKIDWLSLGSVKADLAKPTSPDGPDQDFAAMAFLDALTSTAMPRDERIRLLGGTMSAKLKAAWAEPFDGDKARGEDYNATKLGLELDKYAKIVTGIRRTPEGADSFKIELPLSGEILSYTMKLTKGAAPGEWLVDEFTKQ